MEWGSSRMVGNPDHRSCDLLERTPVHKKSAYPSLPIELRVVYALSHRTSRGGERTSEDVLEVEQGSSTPRCTAWRSADGFFLLGGRREQPQSEVLPSDPAGRKQLVREANRWRQIIRAIG